MLIWLLVYLLRSAAAPAPPAPAIQCLGDGPGRICYDLSPPVSMRASPPPAPMRDSALTCVMDSAGRLTCTLLVE